MKCMKIYSGILAHILRNIKSFLRFKFRDDELNKSCELPIKTKKTAFWDSL